MGYEKWNEMPKYIFFLHKSSNKLVNYLLYFNYFFPFLLNIRTPIVYDFKI